MPTTIRLPVTLLLALIGLASGRAGAAVRPQVSAAMLATIALAAVCFPPVTEVGATGDTRPLLREWENVVPPGVAIGSMYNWLLYIDPRPVKSLAPFSGEQLGKWISEHSAFWAGQFFADDANPHKNNHKPTRYLLAKAAGRKSLLLYEWEDHRYAYTLLESCNAMLLRVRPREGPVPQESVVPGDRVAAVFRHVLHPDAVGGRPVRELLHIPDQVPPGLILSNAPAGRLGAAPPSDWRDNIVGFVTPEDVCLLLFKARGGRRLTDLVPFEDEWLRKYLYSKDGKTLLIDSPRGR